jgi:sugar lactone lactonase YvrE
MNSKKFSIKPFITCLLLFAVLSAELNAQQRPSPIPDDPDPGYLSFIAGGRQFGEGGPAITAFITDWSVALDLDAQGRVYVASPVSNILRIETDDTISTVLQVWPLVADLVVAGEFVYYLNYPLESPDEYPLHRVDIQTGENLNFATLDLSVAQGCCDGSSQIAVDSANHVYIHHGNRIFKVDSQSGETTHVAGNGDSNFLGDTMPAIDASFTVSDMAVDPANDSLVIADSTNRRILRITPDSGEISASAALDVAQYEGSFSALTSVDVHPSGEIYLVSGDRNRIYRLSDSLQSLGVVAGNGNSERSGDGGSALSAGIRPEEIAIQSNGDYYFSSQAIQESLRIRRVDTSHDIVSTVMGIPGYLGCASPFDSRLVFSSGIIVDPSGIIYTQSFNAILAFDTEQGITYTVAGVYGTKGDSEDGVPAFGNAINPIRAVHSSMALAPNGDIYFTEEDRLRSIDAVSGLLGTVAHGRYRMPQYHADGHIYAIREHDQWIDFVKIDPQGGTVSNLVEGGDGIPLAGESAVGRKFTNVRYADVGWGGGRNLNDMEVDSDGNIYLSVNDEMAPDVPSGIYRIDGQTKTLTAVVSEAPDSTRAILGQISLDENNNALYYSYLSEYTFDEGEYVPVVKVDLESGTQTRFAGANIIGDGYPRTGAGQNALESWLHLVDLTVAENGDLYLLQSEDTILKITPESPLAYSLIPEDIAANASIGTAVANHGNWLAVGVPNNPQSNGNTGEVLIYEDNDCRPILRDRLVVPETYDANQFGSSLAFAGNSLVISAPGQPATSLQGKSPPDASTQAESTLKLGVFSLKSNRHWSFDRDLTSHLSPAEADQPISLVAEADTFAVGAPGANEGEGEVLIFNTSDLETPARVKSSETGTRNFGKSIALVGDQLAVGSNSAIAGGAVEKFLGNGPTFASKGILRSPNSEPGFAAAIVMNSEALYVGTPHASGGKVYDYDLDDLALADTLSDPDNAGNPSFGEALDIEESTLVVGAPETRVAIAQGGSSAPDSSHASGAVHVFGIKNRVGSKINGSVLFTILASAAEAYGKAVDMSNGRIVVGAPKTNDGRGSFDPASEIVQASELSGLWYDPSLDGEGFNVLVADAGMVVFYYGYDTDGRRLWLVSGTYSGEFGFGEEINIPVYKAVDGDFAAPVRSSDALVKYGLLTISFGSLRSATFTINGFDGNKISRGTFLADTSANAAAYSGLWYDQSKDGEGYNVISGKPGSVIYYYGSSSNGERLWLVSDLLTNNITDGTTVTGTMYDATGGDFYHPAPSATALRNWGTIEALFNDCDDGRFILTGADGNKTSDVVKLAGVGGAKCN